MEHARTGVQRRTLIGALLGATAIGATVVALLPGGTNSGGSERIVDVETTTTVATTTTEAAATTAAPSTTVQATATSAPIEQQVADHEQRIGTLEATTTTAAPTTTTARPTTTTVYVEPTYGNGHPTCPGMTVSECEANGG